MNALTRSSRRGRSNYDAMLQASIDTRITQAMRQKERWANGDGSTYSKKYLLEQNTVIEASRDQSNKQSEKGNTHNKNTEYDAKPVETETEVEKETSCADPDNQTKTNIENIDKSNSSKISQSKEGDETLLTENVCRQKVDQSKRKCAACLGRFVVHSCGKRSIPEDLEALWLARQKEKEMEEQKKKEEAKRRRARTMQKKKEEKDRREAEAAALKAKEDAVQSEETVENKIESCNEKDTNQTKKEVNEECIEPPAVQDPVGTTISLENSPVNHTAEETVSHFNSKQEASSSPLQNHHCSEENHESSAASSTASNHNFDTMNDSMPIESTERSYKIFQKSRESISENYDDIKIDLRQYQIDLRQFHHYNQFVNKSTTKKHFHHQSCQASNHNMNNQNVATVALKRTHQQLSAQNQNHYPQNTTEPHYTYQSQIDNKQNNIQHPQNTTEPHYSYQNDVENKSHYNNHPYIAHSTYDLTPPLHYSNSESIRPVNNNFNEKNKYYSQSVPPSFEHTTNSNNHQSHNKEGQTHGSIPGQSLNILAAASDQRSSIASSARSSFHPPTNNNKQINLQKINKSKFEN